MTIDYGIFNKLVTLADGSIEPVELDKKIYEAYNLMRPYMLSLSSDILSGILFGKTDECSQNTLKDIESLITYCESIYRQRQLLGETALSYNNQYVDDYCIDCITERFTCRNIKSQDLFKLFSLYRLVSVKKDDPNPPTPQYEDGINFMQLESTGDYPPFQIN